MNFFWWRNLCFARRNYTQSSWLIALLSVSQAMKKESGQNNKVWAAESRGDDDSRGW